MKVQEPEPTYLPFFSALLLPKAPGVPFVFLLPSFSFLLLLPESKASSPSIPFHATTPRLSSSCKAVKEEHGWQALPSPLPALTAAAHHQ